MKSVLVERCCFCRRLGKKARRHGLYLLACERCGIVWQMIDKTQEEYAEYYRSKYHDGVYTHSFEQDLEVAEKRLASYRFPPGVKLLDVGSGNGAFVHVCREQGHDAWGCDLAKGISETKYVYEEKLEDIYFPTDEFHVVTLHDSLEHIPDPVSCVKEISRIIKDNGLVCVDFPHFHSRKGKHHWKKMEHLWFFTEQQIISLFEDYGFKRTRVSEPVPGKLCLVFKKLKTPKRVKILVPPGIGDVYWTLTKMQSFCQKHEIDIPDVCVSSPKNDYKDHSEDYVRMFPFLRWAGYKKHEAGTPIFREAYREKARTIFEDVERCEYFIAYNGQLRWGESMDSVDIQYDTNWFLPMHRPMEARWFVDEVKREYGEYILAYFIPHGMYKYWLKECPSKELFQSLRQIHLSTGKKIILIGAEWDADLLDEEFLKRDRRGFLVNMTGKTTCPQVMELLRQAKGVVGFPSGITIMATMFRTPTLLFWNQYFDPRFWWHACPPQARGVWYDVVNTKTCSPGEVQHRFMRLISEPSKPVASIGKHSVQIDTVDEPDMEEEVEEAKSPLSEVAPDVVEGLMDPSIITVACVYRKNGRFSPDYIKKLKNEVKRNLKKDHRFVCISDTPLVPCDAIEMQNDWFSSWSRIEVFRPGLFHGPVLFLDLNLLVIGELDSLFRNAHSFIMPHGMKDPSKRSSMTMMWDGDYSDIYTDFLEKGQGLIQRAKRPNDQLFIQKILRDTYGVEPEVMQEVMSKKIVSFRRDCRNGHAPKDTGIVAFAGKEMIEHHLDRSWVCKNWK